MCSSCGGGRAAARLPGATPNNPVVFGNPDDRPAQPATFLVNHGKVKAGHYKYVAGDGVEQAVADATIQIGYGRPAGAKAAPVVVDSPSWYVKTANNRWVGFKAKPAAERYAKSVGSVVQTRSDVLRSPKSGSGEQ